MKKIEKLTTETLPETIKDGKTVLLFTASWCGDCRFIKPQFPAIEADFPDVNFVEVDTDASMDLAQELGIFGIPSLVVFNDGQEVDRLVNKNRKTKAEIEAFLSATN